MDVLLPCTYRAKPTALSLYHLFLTLLYYYYITIITLMIMKLSGIELGGVTTERAGPEKTSFIPLTANKPYSCSLSSPVTL